MTTQPFPVLLVEDDANDVFFFERAYTKAEIPNPLLVVNDGQAAVDLLSQARSPIERAQQSMPGIVVLDLNLPVRNGLEVLQWMQSSLRRPLPIVIVLTSSTDPRDIADAYAAGANSYLVKAGDPNQLISLVSLIQAYWLRQNRMPPQVDARHRG